MFKGGNILGLWELLVQLWEIKTFCFHSFYSLPQSNGQPGIQLSFEHTVSGPVPKWVPTFSWFPNYPGQSEAPGCTCHSTLHEVGRKWKAIVLIWLDKSWPVELGNLILFSRLLWKRRKYRLTKEKAGCVNWLSELKEKGGGGTHNRGGERIKSGSEK